MTCDRPFRAPALLLALVALVGLALAPSAQSVQLSRSCQQTMGDVASAFVESPDHQWIVYLADQEQDGVTELLSVRADGSAPPVKLNGPLPAGGGVYAASGRFLVTPGSDRVVYCASHPTTGVMTLFSVPIAGGPSTQLSAATAVDANLDEPFAIAPDGTRVVYSSNSVLHSVAITGGSSAQLSGTGLYVLAGFAISSDSSRVVFVSPQAAGQYPALLSSPI